MRCAEICTGGSNPLLSARKILAVLWLFQYNNSKINNYQKFIDIPHKKETIEKRTK